MTDMKRTLERDKGQEDAGEPQPDYGTYEETNRETSSSPPSHFDCPERRSQWTKDDEDEGGHSLDMVGHWSADTPSEYAGHRGVAVEIRRRTTNGEEDEEEEEAEEKEPVEDKSGFNAYIEEKRREYLAEKEKRENKTKPNGTKQKEEEKGRKSKAMEFFGIFVLWKSTFKEIEGRFGSDIQCYFRFVRLLFVVDVFLSIVFLSTLLLPQILVSPAMNFSGINNCSSSSTEESTAAPHSVTPETNSNEYNETEEQPTTTTSQGQQLQSTGAETHTNMNAVNEEDNYRDTVGRHDACLCSNNYTQHIRTFAQRMENKSYVVILDILKGTEWMELTVLFTGFYFDKPSYLMSVAFLFSVFGCSLVIACLIIIYLSHGIQYFFGNSVANFCEKIFSSWDFPITDETLTKRWKALFRGEIWDQPKRSSLKNHEKTKWKKFRIVFGRMSTALLIGALLIGAAALLYFLQTKFLPELRKVVKPKNETEKELLAFFIEYLPSIVLVLMNAILPEIFKQLLQHFAYLSTDNVFAFSLSLSIFTRLASIVFLFVPLLVDIARSTSGPCHSSSSFQCWETRLGQSMYVLSVTDFVVVVLMTLCFDTAKRCWVTRRGRKSASPSSSSSSSPPPPPPPDSSSRSSTAGIQFLLSEEILDIVYTQTICWIGAFFCPLIVPITAVKLFVFFYVKKLSLFVNCVRSSKPLNPFKIQFMFAVILCISFVLSYFLVSYPIEQFHPSQSCSPFRIYQEVDYRMYRAFSFVLLDWPTEIQKTVAFVFSWQFVFAVSLLMIFLICYFVSKIRLNKENADLFHSRLELVRKDRVFLMRQLKKLYPKD